MTTHRRIVLVDKIINSDGTIQPNITVVKGFNYVVLEYGATKAVVEIFCDDDPTFTDTVKTDIDLTAHIVGLTQTNHAKAGKGGNFFKNNGTIKSVDAIGTLTTIAAQPTLSVT